MRVLIYLVQVMHAVLPQNIKFPPRNLNAARAFIQQPAHAKPASLPRSTTPGQLGVPQPPMSSMVTQAKKPTIKNMPVRVTEEEVLGGDI